MKSIGGMTTARIPSKMTPKNTFSRGKVVMSAASDNTSDFTVTGGQVKLDSNYQDSSFDTSYNDKLLNTSKMERVKNARLITAIKTPYTYSGRIDLNTMDRIVEF